MKKLNLYILFFTLLLISCNVRQKLYLEARENPNQKDKYSEYCLTCMYIVLDKSLAGNKVMITESKNRTYSLFPQNKRFSDTVYYNNLVVKKGENDSEELIKVSNYRAVDIFVNKDTILVRDFTFPYYRFIVVTKKGKCKRPKYIFTNDISNYPKVLDKLNKEIPEITLPEYNIDSARISPNMKKLSPANTNGYKK